MKICSQIIAVFCTAAVALTSAGVTASAEPASAMRDMTTMELVREMGLGINLGNTYESCGDWIAQWGDGTPESYETAWGSPVITQEMIQGYADAGFHTLRVPVAWSNLMGELHHQQRLPRRSAGGRGLGAGQRPARHCQSAL